ncbi:SAVED domain-containing protein [Pandoraea sp. NPDC090278]|uniref:SAVED domain-containing protein n=1 Tax=Pandoraea sp. NPDC090278 TaxID=3364391 RepID=UPI00383A28AC
MGWLIIHRMIIDLNETRVCTVEQVRAILEGTETHDFVVPTNTHARCVWISHFDERAIRDQADWAATLYPKLKGFLQTAAKDNQHLRLIFDAHNTLAFAAGAVLNIKSGRNVEIEQRTVHRNVWHSNDVPRDPSWPGWKFDLEMVKESEGDMAVAVCLTHDVASAVKAHITTALPQASSLLIARPTCGAGARSVVCGQHAFDLAEALALQTNQGYRCISSSRHC